MRSRIARTVALVLPLILALVPGHAPAQEASLDTTLDSLAGAAGRVSTAFAALATRADSLFKAQPGNNGLQFAPTGQMGGSYPGKQ